MATLYSDLLLDPTTMDLDVSQGLQLVESNVTSLRQRLWMRFNVWTRSWYFDESFGFPYRAYLSKKVLKTVLDNKIKEVTRMEPDVLEIRNFNSSMDRVSRSYQAFFEVVTKEQEVVRIAFIGEDEFYYPTAGEGSTTLCDNEGWIEWSNKLYYLINFRLPITGDATWWNTWAGNTSGVSAGSIVTESGYPIVTQDNKTINTQH